MEKKKESRWKRLSNAKNKAMNALCMFQLFTGTAMVCMGAYFYVNLRGQATVEVDAALMAFLLFSLVGLFAISNASLHWKNVSKEES